MSTDALHHRGPTQADRPGSTIVVPAPSGPRSGADDARAFAQLSRQLHQAADERDALNRIATLARAVTSADVAQVVELDSRRNLPRLAATSGGDDAVALVDLERTLGDGPAWQSMRDRVTICIDDFSTERRWPGYPGKVLTTTGYRSALVFCLAVERSVLASLALFARSPRAFAGETEQLGAIYAQHAALALERAQQADRAHHLAEALTHSRQISAACGILMERHRLTEADAFNRLRVASQQSNRKLHDLATEFIQTGSLPAVPAPRPPRVG